MATFFKQKALHIILLLGLISLINTSTLFAQSKKPLNSDIYDTWNYIRERAISSDGKWIIYQLDPREIDPTLKVHDISSREIKEHSFPRAAQSTLSYDSKFVVFKIKPAKDTVKNLRRKKTPKSKFPSDSLGIYQLSRDTLVLIPRVKSYQLPKKSGAWLAYLLEKSLPQVKKPAPDTLAADSTQLEEKENLELKPQEKPEEEKPKDKKRRKRNESEEETESNESAEVAVEAAPEPTPLELAQQKIQTLEAELEEIEKAKEEAARKAKEKPKKPKAENKKNGTKLILRNLRTARQDTFKFVKSYRFDDKGTRLAFVSTGDDKDFVAGVYVYDLTQRTLIPVLKKPGQYNKLTWDEAGTQLSFIADTDTSKAHKKDPVKVYDLYYWQEKQNEASILASKGSVGIPKDWLISQNATLKFAKDGSKLYFGTSPSPLVQDTTLLPEEIVKVDVWNWQDSRLQSQQNAELDEDKKRSYLAVAYPKLKRVLQLATPEIPQVRIVDEGNADYALGISREPYRRAFSWAGFTYQDAYLITFRDGRTRKVKEKVFGSVQISPKGQYIFWYSHTDSTWFTYSIRSGQTVNVTKNLDTKLYIENHDYPSVPGSYGYAGWTENDESFLIYDRFDIWKLDPTGRTPGQMLTKDGRTNRIRYRYVSLDPEINYIKTTEPLILSVFDDVTKATGYFSYSLQKNEPPRKLIFDDAQFTQLRKARQANRFMFSRETFQEFPNIYFSDASFTRINQVSDANPQQSQYIWGNVELVKWIAPNGEESQGLLYKPENFDPGKKYPMITYFYRLLSNRLHRFSSPSPSRSTINPAMYVSNGYLVFMPDITYRIGHPGRSAYDAVVSGVTSLLDREYIDKDKLAIQGQSWGGYQVAYIVTQTDLFAAAMAGAPVSNMTSAYGGIRWGSGLSRMFQYERTQSRIGATLWENRDLYIENSPIFFADQIETPLLMMHNDNDGAVPWYQGIELFVALRRLNKPSWMLTYNGEAHNLRLWQNRKDLSIRMMQFFDYYLRFKPAPAWMKEGVPAMEKGIKKRYELLDEDKISIKK